MKPEAPEQPAAPSLCPVLTLHTQACQPKHTEEDFGAANRCRRDTHYADLIYDVTQQRFWLLRETTNGPLLKAADALKQKLIGTDPTERLKGLDDHGLLSYFLEPKLTSFLGAEEQAREQAITQEMAQIHSRIGEKASLKTSTHGLALPGFTPYRNLDPDDKDIERYQRLERERNQLEAMGQQRALWNGYAYENGHLFAPEAVRARELVQTYLEQREALLNDEVPGFSAEQIAEFRQCHQQLMDGLRGPESNGIELPFTPAQMLENDHKYRYSEFTKTIIRIAAYGLAVPELALQGTDGLDVGKARLEEYLELLKGQATLDKSIEASFQDWLQVSKNRPPGSLFAAEQQQWEHTEARITALKALATKNVAAMNPPLFLLWNPESFQPQPVNRLVNSGFPLREISLPGELERLRHLSVSELSRNYGERLLEQLEASVKAANEWKVNHKAAGAADITPDDTFTAWLLNEDARSIDVQPQWFDSKGLFVAKRLKQYLDNEHIHVDSLQAKGTFEAWAEHLERMVFKKSDLGAFRLFDNSPQAQLIRALTPPQARVQTEVTLEAPSISLSGIQGSASASLDINLARGEVDIATWRMPERNAAKDILARYTNYQGQEETLNFGRLSFECSAKAWGFAGASIMLAANLDLKPTLNGNLEIDSQRGVRRVNTPLPQHVNLNEAVGANFNLFAGVQAGIKLNGSVNWLPPQDVRSQHYNPQQLAQPANDGWCVLAGLGLDVAVAAGLGAKGDFGLSLQNGQLVFSLKATLVAGVGAEGEYSFIVGYEAISKVLELFHNELVRNNYHVLDWVTEDAFEYCTQLQVLRAMGMSLQWVFMLGYGMVTRIATASKSKERTANIAGTIVLKEHDADLNYWYAHLTPEGLGSLLGSLSQRGWGFNYREQVAAHIAQQEAIVIILLAIVNNAESNQWEGNRCYEKMGQAQRRFKKAMVHMEPEQRHRREDERYLDNFGRLNQFMHTELGGDIPRIMKRKHDYILCIDKLFDPGAWDPMGEVIGLRAGDKVVDYNYV